MAHITFYRKYRSTTFDEIVGQDQVVQTLKNAIEFDRLTHAYIFSGPRGTGKTSTARILAKALNCRTGKSSSPCHTCDLCQKIAQGQSVDVIEIDAASNTGVDNIRTLNDQVNFAPVECQYKLYIIDEAHMLSTGAFNALLKTLEEPPENTIFVLATTEAHKLPVTIHSRCQHLYFRNMASTDIVEQLTHIAKTEGITIDEPSLFTIARNAGGSMRDAVSLFDQIYAFKGKEITQDDVLLLLGATQFDHLADLLDALIKKDSKTCMARLKTLLDSGCNMAQLTGDITQTLKVCLFLKMDLKDDIDLDEARVATLEGIAQNASHEALATMLETIAKTEMELKYFPNPDLLLQVRFLMLLKDETAPQAQSAQSAPQTAAPAPQRPAAFQASPSSKPPTPTPPSTMPKSAPAIPTPSAPPAAAAPSMPTPVSGRPSSPQINPVKAAPASSTPAAAPHQSGDDASKWQYCLEQIKAQKPGLYAILKGAQFLGVSGKYAQIKLAQNFKFFIEKLDEESNKDALNTLLSKAFASNIEFKLADADTPVSRPTAAPPSSPMPTPQNTAPQTQATPVAAPSTPAMPSPSPSPEIPPSASNAPTPSASPDPAAPESQKINHIIAMFDGTLVN